MKALDEYILMVVFKLLLNRVHVCANFTFICTEKHDNERIKPDLTGRQARVTHFRLHLIVQDLETVFSQT